MPAPSTPAPAKPAAPGFLAELKDSPGRNLSASVVVFLVALPLCMGIALASGVPVSAGIITGIVGGIVVGALAGAPLQVSGPAAGLTVIVYEIVQNHGLETLGLCVLLGGAVQVACGLAKFGVWFRAVSPAVIRGMLTGIGVLIFASQFHVLVDDKPPGGGLENLVTLPGAVAKGLPWPDTRPRAERAAQVDLLKATGRLHERQEFFREKVAQRVPADFAPTVATAGDDFAVDLAADFAEDAPELAGVQDDIAAELAEDVRRFRAAGLDAGPKGEARAAAGTAAAGAVRDARAALGAAAADSSPAAAVAARDAVGAAERAILNYETSLKNHDVAAKVGLLTILVIVVWQFLVTKVGPLKALNVLPAPLIAVLAATAAAWAFILPVIYVEVPEQLLDEIRVPTWAVLRAADWRAVIGGGLLIGAVASAESLLCAGAVDKLHAGPRANFDKELFAQGVGNVICGALGALPMTGVIVRSSANVRSGGTSRSSAILHGFWLLIFAAFLGGLLALIPTAALAGVLVLVGWKLMDFAAVKELWRVGKGEVAVFFVTVAGIVCFDLLSGVVAGIVLAAVRLLVKFGKLEVESEPADAAAGAGSDRPVHHLRLRGAATFLKLPKLADALERVPPGTDVRADLTRLSYIDHACVELLAEWRSQHERTGGSLAVDWDVLHDRFRKAADPTDAARTPRPAPQDFPTNPDAAKPDAPAEPRRATLDPDDPVTAAVADDPDVPTALVRDAPHGGS